MRYWLVRARGAEVEQQLADGVLGRAGQPHGGADAVALALGSR